jgi:O-succinylbenzoate synthase
MKKINRLADEKIRIKSANVWMVELPMKKPFTTSFGSITRRPFLVVELVCDETGYGEAAVLPEPTYNGEDVETAKRMLSILLPKIVSSKVCYNDVKETMSAYKGHNIAKSAVDYAFWYAISKITDVPLLSMTNPSKDRFRVQESVPIGSLKLISDWVEGAYERGVRSIKLKIMPGHSWRIAKYVKENYDPEFISVDANASFDPRNKSHVEELHKVSEYVDEIEQPFRAKNLLAHARLSESVKPVISLDESIESLDDAIEYSELAGRKAVINIKPPRLGGLYSSWELAVEMARRGTECFMGGLLETSLGRGFNMAIATMKSVCDKYPADFSPASDFYKDDITKTSFEIENGIIRTPKSRTVPFEVDRGKLRQYGRIIASY